MNIWPFGKHKQEVRADTNADTGEIVSSDALLSALLGKDVVDKQMALEIPAVQACLQLIAGTVSSLPICLYETTADGEVKKVPGDPRLRLLNSDTGDTLTAAQFWRAMIEDYYLGKGGYAYLNADWSGLHSIHYVDERHISFLTNTDPIFKDYKILVDGRSYEGFRFLKILRKTKDGWKSSSVIDENGTLLNVEYSTMIYERNLVARGGNKRGFLQSEKPLSESAFAKLKEAFRRMYSSSDENVVMLNNGVKFQEASNTSVEMQLRENKEANSRAICQIFGIPPAMIFGGPQQNDVDAFIRTIATLLNDIECSLDRDLLTYEEAGYRYFAFDTRELTRGNVKERYEAYEIGIRNHFVQPDEVREMEDMEPMGFNWITLGLDSVLMDPATKMIYTPNTNQMQNLDAKSIVEGGESDEGRDTG